MPVSLELEWNGPEVADAFDKRALSALEKAGQVGEETAQGLARVRTGFMRDSVFVITDVIGQGQMVLIVGDSADYAIFNELGTSSNGRGGGGMQAQPFIRPGGDRAASVLFELLAQESGS